MLVGEQSVQLDVNGGHQDPLQVRGFYIEIASLMSEVIRGVHSIFTPLVFLVLRGNRRHVLQLCGFVSLAPWRHFSSAVRANGGGRAGTSCSVTSDGLTGGNLGYGLFNVQRHDFMHLKKSSQDQEFPARSYTVYPCSALFAEVTSSSVISSMTSLVGALHRSRSEETQQLGMLRRFLRQNQAVESTARLPPVREFARNSGAGTPGERGKRGGGRVWRCGDVVVEWELVWRISARWTGVWTSCGTKWSAVTQTSGSS